jgi:glucose-1-phosphate cytidylyltransferase
MRQNINNISVVILAGGLGTRISEESTYRPKPLIDIGGKPIIWHILKNYSAFGLHNFIICGGYKCYLLKEYFANYFIHDNDVTFDIKNNSIKVHHKNTDPWKVTVIDTGESTMTGGRLLRIKKYLKNKTFCMTYGDGLADVNIKKLLAFHYRSKAKATVTAVQPPGRFGSLNISNHNVRSFAEKPNGDGGWINGGFFVLEPEIFQFIDNDSCVWEREPLERLAQSGMLNAYKHFGFWQAMDTLRDKNYLEKLWESGKPPWKVW